MSARSAQHAGANQAGGPRPKEDGQHNDDISLAGSQIDADQNDQWQEWQDQNQIREAHEERVDPAAEISAGKTNDCADQNSDEGNNQARE